MRKVNIQTKVLSGSSIIFLNVKILKTSSYLLFSSTSEKMLTSLLFVGTILCSLDAYEFAIALQKSEYFSDEGDVSYENDNGTLLEVTKSSRMTNSRCAAECLQDLSCNAIELCSTPTAKTCRLSRSWKYTGGTLSQPTCKRFQIVSTTHRLKMFM